MTYREVGVSYDGIVSYVRQEGFHVILGDARGDVVTKAQPVGRVQSYGLYSGVEVHVKRFRRTY